MGCVVCGLFAFSAVGELGLQMLFGKDLPQREVSALVNTSVNRPEFGPAYLE